MSCYHAVFFLALMSRCICSDELWFPSWFKFGSATSAYQVEGAWNISDKGASKWDTLTHMYPDMIKDKSNGDVACNSYYLWKRDLEMASELGLDFYRFSINWPRLLPYGFSNYISEDGSNYYSNLIDGLLARGIEPVVTLYHWEMPQVLQDLGGWTNPLITEWFADYARVAYTLYGDRVKTWITINEPIVECDWYHGSGIMTPGSIGYSNVGTYLCNKYILIAHAKAWRIYDEEFRHIFDGKVSLCNHLLWMQPYTEEDKNLTDMAREYFTGRFSHPIFSKEGGWPTVIKEKMEQLSRSQGYSKSILPPFNPEETNLTKGTYDFYGVNHYTTRLVRKPRVGEVITPFLLSNIPEINAVFDQKPEWEYGYNKMMPIRPEGLREQLAWLKQQYGDIEMAITENGLSGQGRELNDTQRVSYIRRHLEQVLLSINDGINVTMYSYWSLMDNFEWLDGYQLWQQNMRTAEAWNSLPTSVFPANYNLGAFKARVNRSHFGLYEVNFTDPLRKRTPRSSAAFYASVIKHRSLNAPLQTSIYKRL